MLLLLPPSERKEPALRGAPVDLRALSHPELTAAREQVLDALAAVSATEDAAALLGAGPAAAAEVAANTRWRTEPAQRVSALYTGVLFDALDLPSLPAAARARALRSVRVVSAALGLLRLGDAVPAHRLAMGVTLPGPGPLAAFWRPRLADALDPLLGAPGQVVLDARSSTYAQAWRPPGALAGRVVALGVLRVRDGRSSVVSHDAKRTRGLVVRHLLARAGVPRSPDALVAAVAEAFEVQDAAAQRRLGQPRRIDVVLRD